VTTLALARGVPGKARAGGLYLYPRGVETGARAGASVAGVRTPHALWYNPANLVDSKRQLLVDFTLPFIQTQFTRRLDNGITDPTVSGNSVPIPIPTLAFTDNLGFKRLGFGIALLVPPANAASWPSQLPNGDRAPQRYSVLDNKGSFIGTLALGAAYRATDRLQIGAALYLTAAQIGATVAVSACDYAFCSQPEGKEWEGRARFLLGPTYTASANFGASYDFDWVRLGASVQIRTKISGEARFDLQLPDQALFDNVQLHGPHGSHDLKADMSVTLPTIVRFGAEFNPLKDLRMELAGSWENWSQQQSIRVVPKDVVATNVPGVGTVQAQPMNLARNMRDTWSVSLGGSYDLSRLFQGKRQLTALAGVMYETGAFANQDLSPATIDSQKVLTSLGASVEVARGLFIDASYGHLFMQNHNVTDSHVLLPAAIKPTPDNGKPGYQVGDRPAIGNGKYVMEGNIVGLGLRWKLDQRRTERQPPPAAAAKQASPAPQEVEPTLAVPAAAPAEMPAPQPPAPQPPAPQPPAAGVESQLPAPAAEPPAAPDTAPVGAEPAPTPDATPPAEPAAPPAEAPTAPAETPAPPTEPAQEAPAPGAPETPAPPGPELPAPDAPREPAPAPPAG
jgi:long-subunit fatty acid transport protein